MSYEGGDLRAIESSKVVYQIGKALNYKKCQIASV